MDRRRFLGGVFGGVVAGGVLVKATDNDIVKFAQSTEIGEPMVSSPLENNSGLDVGSILYDHRGRAIAVVDSFTWERGIIDGSPDTHGFRTFLPGLTTIRINAVMHGPVHTTDIGWRPK